MKLYKLFILILLWIASSILLFQASGQERPGNNRPGTGGGAGGGGVVSNRVIVAVVADLYTNNTPHYIDGIGNIGTTTAGSLVVSVTNSSNARYAWYSENVGTAGATTNQISFSVPPGGWWKFSGVTTTLSDGSQTLIYVATNGSVNHATTAGSASSAASVPGSGVTGDIAAAQLTNALMALLTSREVHVAKNGSVDYPGTLLYPKPAITNGADAAVADDTVMVHPGRYTEHAALRVGVNYFGYPGATIFFNQTIANTPEGIWDDRFIGATTNIIEWNGDMYFLGSTNGEATGGSYEHNEGSRGLLVVTNPASKINFKAKDLYVRDISAYQSIAAITVLNARQVDVEVDGIYSPEYGNVTIQVVDSIFGTADCSEFAMGVWWEHGPIYSKTRVIKVNNYSIWPEGRDENTSPVDGWFEGDYLGSKIYINAGTNRLYKSWFRFKELEAISAGSQALSIYGGGTHYFDIPKIKGGAGAAAIEIASQAGGLSGVSDSENYVTTQKLESDTKYVTYTATNATLRLSALNFKGFYGGEGFTLAGTSRLFPTYSLGGRTNVSAATSLGISINPPMPSSNYIFTVSGPAITNYTVLTQTRSNVTVVFPETTSIIHWHATLNAQ